jgi:hypothetical protein
MTDQLAPVEYVGPGNFRAEWHPDKGVVYVTSIEGWPFLSPAEIRALCEFVSELGLS